MTLGRRRREAWLAGRTLDLEVRGYRDRNQIPRRAFRPQGICVEDVPMRAEDLDGGEFLRPLPRFQTLANGEDRFDDPLYEADGGGGGGDAAFEPEEIAPPGRRPGRTVLLIGGLMFAAFAAGAAVSWSGLPALSGPHQPPASPAPVAQLHVELTPAGGVQAESVQVARPTAQTAPVGPANASRGPTPALRPDRFAAPSVEPQASAVLLPKARAETRDLRMRARPAVQPPAAVFRADPDRLAVALAPAPRPGIETPPVTPRPAAIHVPGALDCANVVSPAQELACRDPGLRAQERRMSEAYAGALAAGAPERQLRRAQVDWLNMREDAALDSRQAVERLYRQRIQELEEASGGPP